MTLNAPMPVLGYRHLTDEEIEIVNQHKDLEEHLLRHLDDLMTQEGIDQRWLAISRTHFEQGFMALNRSVFRPQRIEGDLDISLDWRAA